MIRTSEFVTDFLSFSLGDRKAPDDIRCRYMVFDVDYDPNNPTPEAGYVTLFIIGSGRAVAYVLSRRNDDSRFSTTLKSIVPLPDIRDRKSTYPEHDYIKGTQVMALYPDTTSFYSAKIVAGPFAMKVSRHFCRSITLGCRF